jgi:F420-0:gamma-glutamyl ligase
VKVTPLKTAKITPNATSIFELLERSFNSLPERSVVVVSSKLVSLCEGNVVPLGEVSREELIVQEAEKYLPKEHSKYGHHFTIRDHTVIGGAGIDESNGDEHFVLWPRDAQKTANDIRKILAGHFGVKEIGVVIVDSTSQLMRRGTNGIALAHSGFLALNDYRGRQDLFGKEMHFSMANVSGGLAAAAVLTMGEGDEQTPLCLIEDVPFVEFQQRDPNAEELAELNISLEDDLFAPFLQGVPWKDGAKRRK